MGIPGVGKTTVVSRARELLVESGTSVEHVTFGTTMFEEASKIGIVDRDRMRRLPIGEQKDLQMNAAVKIAKMTTGITLIDTHLFILTQEGYLPGLPGDILTALRPTNLVLIEASVPDVISRRLSDTTRSRDSTNAATIDMENNLAKAILAASSVISGCPLKIIKNENEMVDAAADELFQTLK